MAEKKSVLFVNGIELVVLQMLDDSSCEIWQSYREERERIDTEPTAQMTGDKSLTGWSSLWLHLFLLNGVMWWL